MSWIITNPGAPAQTNIKTAACGEEPSVTGAAGSQSMVLPLVMVGAMLLVILPLCAFVAAIGLLFTWRGPTGAAETVREVLALPATVVPGYFAALRQVRSPGLWGGVTGLAIGTVVLTARLLEQGTVA